jgi:hypothetical protein
MWLVFYGVFSLTSSTFIPVKTYFLAQSYLFITFFICGGTTEKSCEGLVGPIPMGATSCPRLSRVVIRDGTTGKSVRDE